MVFLLALYISSCGLICLVQGQNLTLSTKFMSGNVIFTWTPSNYSSYDVLITRDTTSDTTWTRVSDTQYTVRDVLLYKKITINVRTIGSNVDNKLTYNVSNIKTKVGDTVNLTWTASFFPLAGQYNVYHTYRENKTIFNIRSSGVIYGGNNQSTKYTYLTRPITSTNIMFEIRDITLDDAGYYNGGATVDAAWSGGGVVLVVNGKPKITGDFNVEVNTYLTVTCSSNSTSAPNYYSKLLILSYTWSVNETKMGREKGETLRLYVTKNLKYNKYTCIATEDDIDSYRSDPVQINPLYGPDRIIIIPAPKLNSNDKLTVREGETIGPFDCTADCNPSCNITWRVKTSDGFSDARSEMGTLLQQTVQRDMRLFRCIADRGNKTLKQNIQLDVQYLNDTLLYINGQTKSNIELNENAPLIISCRVGGNPAPKILLSRSHSDTELRKMQGTWLNYTIDTAQCTDTDTYRCSGTSTGFSNTEKVININVLCNTRFDKAGSFKSTYGSKSGTDTTINVAVPIIANPPPQSSDFKWDGPVQVQVPVTSTISTGDVSYKHVIESVIPVKDHTYFGYYTLSYKGQPVTRITINAEDVPQTPSNFTGYSYTIGSVNLTWVSGFNGGPAQLFILYVMEGSNWKVIGNVSDPGEGRLVHFDPGFLSPGQEYSFRIQSCNRINCSLLSADTRVTVKAISSQSTLSNNQGVTIGASLAGFVLIVLLAAFLAMYFLKKKKIEKNRESVKLDDSRQPDVVLYASVDKSDQKRNKNNADVVINDVIVDKKDNSPAPCGDMYASVDKSLLKKKGKQPDANTNEEHENLYANSEETKPAIKPIRGQKGKRSKVKRGSKGQEQKDTGANGEYGNVESRKVNQDGLIYIDVDFSNYTGSQTTDQNPLIHGDDDRTEYTFVDFTKKAPPIQETGDEEQKNN